MENRIGIHGKRKKRERKKVAVNVGRKRDFFYKIGEKLYDRSVRKMRKLPGGQTVRRHMEMLYPGKAEEKTREYYAGKLSLGLKLVAAGAGISAVLAAVQLLGWGDEAPLLQTNQISRGGYLESEKRVVIQAELQGEEKLLELEIPAKQYTREQLETLREQLRPQLEKILLAENEDYEQVNRPLQLTTHVEGYPFEISWLCSDYQCIRQDGALGGKSGTAALTARLSCDDFRAEEVFYLRVVPEESESQSREKALMDALADAQLESRYEDVLVLPAELEGESIRWTKPVGYSWLLAAGASVILAALLFRAKDMDLQKKVKQRGEQLGRAYPEMVCKLSVYVGAGMPIRSAWERIAAQERLPCLQEEMGIALQEMRSGVAEAAAYAHFGNRCGERVYNRFAALLEQNLKKGSTRLNEVLAEESALAFEERKNTARKRGEEAGTKLLFPMMLLLADVMIMIMVPAFMSF